MQYQNIPRIEMAVANLLATYAYNHAKVFCVRFDVRFPEGFIPTKPYERYVSYFTERLNKELKKGLLHPAYRSGPHCSDRK